MRLLAFVALAASAAACTPIPPAPGALPGATRIPVVDLESAIIAAEDSGIRGQMFERTCSSADSAQLQQDICVLGTGACGCWAYATSGPHGIYDNSIGLYAIRHDGQCPECLTAAIDQPWSSGPAGSL